MNHRHEIHVSPMIAKAESTWVIHCVKAAESIAASHAVVLACSPARFGTVPMSYASHCLRPGNHCAALR